MKRICLGLLLFFFIFPIKVLAHSAGYPPFFNINNTIPRTSPAQILGVIPTNITIAQDIAAENYLVNEPITFLIDGAQLEKAFNQDFVQSLQYTWSYGDNQQASGINNVHTYKKTGTYLLSILATADPATPPSLIESVELHILPNKQYRLPKAVMKIQDTIVKDPLQDIVKVDFRRPITFDASKSQNGSGKIVKYMWDFGDDEKSEQPVITRSYTKDETYETPFLRVIDENGLVSDTFVTLTNEVKPQSKNNKVVIILLFNIIFLLLIASAIIFFFFVKPKNKK